MVNENSTNLAYLLKDDWIGSIAKANTINSDSAELVNKYRNELSKHSISDRNVIETSFNYLSFIVAILTFAISLPVYLIWLLYSLIIVKLCNEKIKNPIFIDSMIVGGTMICTGILTIGVFIFFTLTVPSWWPMVFTIASLYGALSWFRTVSELPFLWQHLKWLGFSDEIKANLRFQRAEIMKVISRD